MNLIVATDQQQGIGKDNALLWHLPADLKYFRKLTTGNIVVMGRKTYQSIGRPLPNRLNIVVSRNSDFCAEGCFVVPSLEEAKNIAHNGCIHPYSGQPIFIIGGAEIYKQSLPLVTKIYLTEVKAVFDADTFFPQLLPTEWQEIWRESHLADEKNLYNYDFLVLIRR
jgi:dihydrofolate reductase